MRLAGTALICVVAAFGAAFLVARAANHPAPARAATPPTTHASVPAPARTPDNAELRSEFTPMMAALKPRPRRHRHRVVHHSTPAPAAPSAPQITPQVTPQTTTPQNTTPYTPTPVVPTQPSTSGSGTTHKTHSGGGSGTTTIGG